MMSRRVLSGKEAINGVTPKDNVHFDMGATRRRALDTPRADELAVCSQNLDTRG